MAALREPHIPPGHPEIEPFHLDHKIDMSENKTALELMDYAFVLTRELDAPRSLVYRAWADPELFKHWWGPHRTTNRYTSVDARVGGRFRLLMGGADGNEYAMNGAIVELQPEHRIVMDLDISEHPQEWHAFYNAARQVAADTPLPIIRTTITLEDIGGNRTRMQVEQRYDLPGDSKAFVELGAVVGWEESAVKLDGLLATLSTEDKIIMERTLQAPIDLVWKTWSDPAHVGKWWGPNGFTTTTHKHDFRPGGTWQHTMHGPDGTDYPNYTRYIDVEPLSRITYTNGVSADDPNAFWAEVTFERVDEKRTRVRLMLVVQKEARNGYIEFGAFEGADQTLSRLNAFLNPEA